MFLLRNVQVPPLARYLAVKVLLPAVKPDTKNVALAATVSFAARAGRKNARMSLAATPVAAKLMKHFWPTELFEAVAVTVTIALPPAVMVAVAEGPMVARST